MILSEEEVQGRLDSPDNLMNQMESYVEIRRKHQGKLPGATTIPPMVRELVGSLSNESDEYDKDIAETFNVSQPIVSSASRGLISTSNGRFDSELAEKVKSKVNDKLEAAHNLAIDAMVSSLELLTPKLSEITKPKDLSKIATDMSRISANLKGDNVDKSTRVQVVLMAPSRMRRDDEYEALEVQ